MNAPRTGHRRKRDQDVAQETEGVRERVPRVEEDRSLAAELAGLADGLRTGEVVLA